MITQTEILTLAIKAINAELDKWYKLCCGDAKTYNEATTELREKLTLLHDLYKIQTGEEFQ